MNIEKVIQEDRQAKLTVEYTPEEFEGFKRRAAKKISRNAKIPGFRPGKAPYQVIINHYGEGTIIQEALDILLEDDYSRILEEAEIEPSGAGNIETIDSYDPPKFVFFVPLEPEIDLGDYREIRVAYEPEDFDVSEVDRYITNLRRNSATIIPANRPADVEDLVYFNLSGEFLNLGENEDATITDKTPQQVVIPNDDETSATEWPYPGFARALLGVNSGDVKEIQYTYPEDFPDEEFQGRTAIFTVEVQSVKALELPEFDEDFVQTMGNYDTPEEFRDALETQMRAEHDENYEREYFNTIVDEIIENASMTYPPQMLEHEEEHVLEDIKSRLEKQNLDYETFLKLRDMDEETFIKEEVRPGAKQRLERSLVLDALVDVEGLKLDQEMFNERINEVMGEIFQSGNMEEVQKQMGKEEFSRAISMEGFSRTINTQLRNRLVLIGKGLPIPEEDEVETADAVESNDDALLEGDAQIEDSEQVVDEEELDENTASLDATAQDDAASDLAAEQEEIITEATEAAIIEQGEEALEKAIPSEENEPGEESVQETDTDNNE